MDLRESVNSAVVNLSVLRMDLSAKDMLQYPIISPEDFMKTKNYLLFFVFIFASCLFLAQPFSFAEDPDPVKVELISEVQSFQPGKPFWVGLRFKMDPGWHTYWKNPGEVGLPNKVTWNLPEGFEAGELHWPFPKKIMEADIVSFAYEGEVVLLAEIKSPSSFQDTGAALKTKVGWLACKEICLPGEANLALTLPVKTDAPELDERFKDLFVSTRTRLPDPNSGWNFKVKNRWGKYVLEFSSPEPIDSAEFFSMSKRVVNLAVPQEFKKTKAGYKLTLAQSKDLDKSIKQFQGVLVCRKIWKGFTAEQAFWVDLKI